VGHYSSIPLVMHASTYIPHISLRKASGAKMSSLVDFIIYSLKSDLIMAGTMSSVLSTILTTLSGLYAKKFSSLFAKSNTLMSTRLLFVSILVFLF
jgi:hypothetical protein